MKLGQTPSQTVGPYFAYGLTPEQYLYDHHSVFPPVLANDDTPGEFIRITGQVIDGAGKPINDAMIEIAHADAEGNFVTSLEQVAKTGFTGFGRCGTGTDAHNRYSFETIKPGACAAGEAPYINVIVTMRGMLVHAFTRIYFSDEAAANANDAVLNSVPAERRHTLIAQRQELNGRVVYHFNIHMQGDNETVFFDL